MPKPLPMHKLRLKVSQIKCPKPLPLLKMTIVLIGVVLIGGIMVKLLQVIEKFKMEPVKCLGVDKLSGGVEWTTCMDAEVDADDSENSDSMHNIQSDEILNNRCRHLNEKRICLNLSWSMV